MDILPAGMQGIGPVPVALPGAEAAFAAVLGEMLVQPAPHVADVAPSPPRAEPPVDAPAIVVPPVPLSPVRCQPEVPVPVPVPVPVSVSVAAPAAAPSVAAAEVAALPDTEHVTAAKSPPTKLPIKPAGPARVAKPGAQEHDIQEAEPAHPNGPAVVAGAIAMALVPLPSHMLVPVQAPICVVPPGAQNAVREAVTAAPAQSPAAPRPSDTPTADPPAVSLATPAAGSETAVTPERQESSTVGTPTDVAAPEPLPIPLATAPAPPVPMRALPARVDEAARPAAVHPHHQVEAAVTAVLHRGPTAARTVICLNPAELGAVQIKVDRPKEGGAAVTLTVERPATLLLLLRDREGMGQALDRAGVPAENRVITYQVATPATPIDSPYSDAASGQGQSRSGDFGQHTGGQDGHAAPDRKAFLAAEPEAEPTWSSRTDCIDITA